MLSYLAATTPADPTSYYFNQGVLGVTVVVLALVIRFMFKYYTGKMDEKDLKIETLQKALVDSNVKHADDYRQMALNEQSVLSGITQTQELLAAKIETGKSGN